VNNLNKLLIQFISLLLMLSHYNQKQITKKTQGYNNNNNNNNNNVIWNFILFLFHLITLQLYSPSRGQKFVILLLVNVRK